MDNFRIRRIRHTRDSNGDREATIYSVGFGLGAHHHILTTLPISHHGADKWLEMQELMEYNIDGVPEDTLLAGIEFKLDPETGELGLLQIYIGSKCLLYQITPRTPAGTDALRYFLTDENIVFVSTDTDAVMTSLRETLFCDIEFHEQMWKDVGDLAEGEMADMEFNDLVRTVLDIVVPPAPASVTSANWANEYLDGNQVIFGTLEAYLSFELGKAFHAWD